MKHEQRVDSQPSRVVRRFTRQRSRRAAENVHALTCVAVAHDELFRFLLDGRNHFEFERVSRSYAPDIDNKPLLGKCVPGHPATTGSKGLSSER